MLLVFQIAVKAIKFFRKAYDESMEFFSSGISLMTLG